MVFMLIHVGVQLEGGKRYSQTVLESFHVTHAALGGRGNCPRPNILVSVRLEIGNEDYIICYLGDMTNSHVVLQESLDLEIAKGEEVVLYTESEGSADPFKDQGYVVHLTGYCIPREHLANGEALGTEVDQGSDEIVSCTTTKTVRNIPFGYLHLL